MTYQPKASHYPPNIFYDGDDDEDRQEKAIFHRVFDPVNPLDLAAAAGEIDKAFPLYTQAEYDDTRRRLEAGESAQNPEMVTDSILFYNFVPLAKQIPFDHPTGPQRLLDLLFALRALPPKPAWSRPYGGRNAWDDCEKHFDGLLNYEYNGGLVNAAVAEPANAIARQEARNFNRWAALAYARLGLEGSVARFPLWVFRDALEDYAWYGADARLDAKTVAALDILIPLAADWILLAGEHLSTCTDSYGTGGKLWKGPGQPSGYSAERWRMWKAQFLGASKTAAFSVLTQDLARVAAEQIHWVELTDEQTQWVDGT